MKHLAILPLLLLAAVPFLHSETAGSVPPPPVAAKMLDLFDRLRAAQAGNADRNTAFNLSEADINDYMRYALKTTPRPGVDSVTVKFFPKDYISTFARVDFDAVERWRPGTIPTVLRPILKGKKAIWIDCRIHAEGSNLTFTVEKARYDDVPLPAFFAEKLIQIVAAQQPEKYDTSNPLPLPFGLVKVSTSEHVLQLHN